MEAGGSSEPLRAGGVLAVTEGAFDTVAATCDWLGGACVAGTRIAAPEGEWTTPGNGAGGGAAGCEALGVVEVGGAGGAATELALAGPPEAASSGARSGEEEERGASMSDSVLPSISSATAAS